MSSSVEVILFPIYGKIKNVPKHQAVVVGIPHSWIETDMTAVTAPV